MALIKVGESYFNQDQVVYIQRELYTAKVYLKGVEKPVEIFPVDDDDIKLIGEEKKDE